MAELVLEEAIRQYHIRRLREEIDAALAAHDRGRFMELAAELARLTEPDGERSNRGA
ncbi:MAG: IDEAL domain-containing protein [Hydrogenibacillus schlegelii]|uniref:IDEAL domain-containing protein n=2 Tax=Hydrogenibacillus schlegelii TaxID=1484 RepID=A0A947CX79_HYDSH|nr:IDEAL domain-containing protein [Hydrogenibacillus schlegelii]MBT9282784.1 IDEAL domain-containing protein [Hydrogenibacillus schlegelii]